MNDCRCGPGHRCPVSLVDGRRGRGPRSRPSLGTDAGAGPAVLLLPAQPGSSAVWSAVGSRLRDLGLQVLAIDGHGQPGPDLFGRAAAVAAILAERGTGPVVVVGHSLGAGVALALAARFPQHVKALVLIAPAAAAGATTKADRMLAAPVIGPPLRWLGTRRVRRAPRASSLRHMLPCDRQLRPMLAGITVPTVILAGTRDRVVPLRAATDLARRLPAGTLLPVEAGHLLPTDAPEAVVAAVLRAVRHGYRASLRGRIRCRPAPS